MGWDDGRVTDCPGPALVLSDGNRADLSTDGQAATGDVVHVPHALGREQSEDPSTSATVGACSTTGVALRPAAIDPAGLDRRRRSGSPRTTVQPADAGDGTSSCLPSMPWFIGELPNAGVNSANLAAVRSIRDPRSTYRRALVNNLSSSAC
jgi:hypothetical protein